MHCITAREDPVMEYAGQGPGSRIPAFPSPVSASISSSSFRICLIFSFTVALESVPDIMSVMPVVPRHWPSTSCRSCPI